AAAFAASVPQLQTEMDGAVQAMTEGGAPSQQIAIAVRQNLFADRMLRRVTIILQGGISAISAADALSREVTIYGQLLNALYQGAPDLNIQRVNISAAREKLAAVDDIFQAVQADVDSILSASTELFTVKEASDQIFL